MRKLSKIKVLVQALIIRLILCGNEKLATKTSSMIQSCMSFLRNWLRDLALHVHFHLSLSPSL